MYMQLQNCFLLTANKRSISVYVPQLANTTSDAGEDILQVAELNRWRRRRFPVSAATTGSRRRARISRSATCRRRRRAATIVLLTGQRGGSDGSLWLWCG